ncbi:glucose-1-phosphate thymidylyltransferase [Streptomyces sp. NPDC059176]|uniref:glucose-1-phosphate thymidylyltransferase n=1 Tax=Streptomyces sp. NPDC059176 TaxID=3346758 RepID=UPI00367F8DFD
MKGLVLSGGTGTRLRPFTYSMPKQLMPVANKPVLHYCLENLRDLGVTSVGVIVGERVGQVEQAIGDGADLGLEITYLFQEAPLGLAHCVTVAEQFLADDDFVMYLGDNMLIGDLAGAARDFTERRPAAKVLVTKVDDPQHYGVAELDSEGRVVSLAEKPEQPRSDLAMMGVYFFSPAIHEAVRRVRPSARGELEITDAVQHLLDSGQDVTAEIYQGYWADTGGVKALLECNRVVLDGLVDDVRGRVDQSSVVKGPVAVGAGSEIVASHLEGPLTIGAGCVIRHARIGPHTAVGQNCLIENTDVQESIVLENVQVEGVRGVRDSVIGKGARVQGIARDVESQCLLLGDQTSIQVRSA